MLLRRLAVVTALALAVPLAVTPPGTTSAQAAPPPPDPITHVDLLGGATTGLTAQRAATVLERELPTDDAVIVGLAWTPAGDASPTATIRFRTADGWGEWQEVEMMDLGEGQVTSDGMIAMGADRLEVRLTGLDEAPVTAAEVMLVDPPEAAPATAPQEATLSGTTAGLQATVARPAMFSRAQWGASEVLPYADCEPNYAVRLQRFVVHHTAGTNSYNAGDSPRIIRGIQAYHVGGRGWCDVGYNFLVDKFGQVFEGRRGGTDKLVVGVHASGQNSGGVGVSVLGNYVAVDPPAAAIDAIIRVIGWKSYLHGVDPTAMSNKGGVNLPMVIGHQQVAQTSCPGSFLNVLGMIASQARSMAVSGVPQLGAATGGTGALFRDGARIAVGVPVPARLQYTIRSGDTVVAHLTRDSLLNGTLTQPWNGSVPGTDAYLPTGTYAVQIQGASTLGRPLAASTSVTLQYPTGFTGVPRDDVLDLPATSGGDSHTVPVGSALGVSSPDIAHLVLRVCGSAGQVTVTPDGRTHGAAVDPAAVPGGCALLLVPASPTGTLRVDRAAGAGATTVDGVGWLSSATPAMAFRDVPDGMTFAEDIQWIYAAGITTGHTDGTYRPDAPVTREAMAAFIYRAAGSPAFAPPAEPTFEDVDPGHPFYLAIEWLAARRIATGTRDSDGDYEFRPSEWISREAMAAFLFRLSGDPVPAAPAGERPFIDVPDGYVFENAIRWMGQSGITTGFPDGTFRSNGVVRRDAMAAFLHRASGQV